VLDGDPAAPSPKGAQHPPHFAVHVHCGQTAGWIRIPLGMGLEVGLGPGHIVLHGDPTPPKGAKPPLLGPYLLWRKGWMDQDASNWYGGRPLSRPHCVRWGTQLPLKRGTAPTFRPMSIVAKRLDGSRCHLVYEDRLQPRPHCQMGTAPQEKKNNGAQPQCSAHVYCD